MDAFAKEHAELLTALAILSAVTFFASLIAVPLLIARIPADYFVRDRPHRIDGGSRWYWWLAGKLFKNTLGAVLLLGGIIMLGLPGQGLLTMLVGIMLLDYPGKRALELKLIRRPHLLRAINWVRRRRGCAPLIVDEPSS